MSSEGASGIRVPLVGGRWIAIHVSASRMLAPSRDRKPTGHSVVARPDGDVFVFSTSSQNVIRCGETQRNMQWRDPAQLTRAIVSILWTGSPKTGRVDKTMCAHVLRFCTLYLYTINRNSFRVVVSHCCC